MDIGENEIVVYKLDHATLKLKCFQSVAMSLSDSFSFMVEGAKFSPAFKMGQWDGYIRLFQLGKRTLPSGLFNELLKVAESSEYKVTVEENPNYPELGLPGDCLDDLLPEDTKAYVDSLNIHSRGVKLVPDDFQYHGIHSALFRKQLILHAATSSGKSLMVYSITRYLTEVLDKRVLIIVPTVNLVNQFISDFKDYSSENGYDVQKSVHPISAGVQLDTDKQITLSTFQSLAKATPDYFKQFDCVLTDEGHKITAASFQKIYGQSVNAEWRLACTGTLQDLKCNLLTMIGLTGPVEKIITAAELIERGRATPLKIKALQLNYDAETCAAAKKMDYDTELDWLLISPKRNKFISKLAASCSGTTMVMFHKEDHGKLLYEKIKELVGDKLPVYFINGGVAADERESIRQSTNEVDCIIVASLRTMSTGANMPAVSNIIYAHPTKDAKGYIQTIGRGIRLRNGKTHCNFFDIGDNLTHKRKVNHTFRHFGLRMETLMKEGHEFETVLIKF